jgi:diketogulonate reductase-like aldo/keto reductase
VAKVERARNVNGVEVPSFLYGTAWKEEQTRELVLQAVTAGFRGIDTANQRRHYVEAAVGDALGEVFAAGSLKRDDVFLQTKYTYARGQDHRLPYDPDADYPTQVRQSFESSLEHLGTSRVDAYLLHGPAAPSGLTEDDLRVWETMEALVREGRVKLLGVSNVSVRHLAKLVELDTEPVSFVQNRCFARTGWDREVRAFCRQHGIVYQAFSLLTANGRELASPVVKRIAERHRKTVEQVAFRFALQVGMLPLTGSRDATHLRQDLACFDFELDEDEVATLERVGG